VVGDARIVSLGEATHGTREFFQMKHRMLEFLATEMGFNIFSIEANMPEAYRLNDFVLNGAGDPKKLLAGVYFWTWNTGEVLDMILWMCDFNALGKGRLQFTGFDVQTTTVAMQIAKDFLAGADPDKYQRMNTVYTQMAAQSSGFGVATASFPVAAARGTQFRFSGYIRTADI
jgi:erythromycin esterase